KKIPMSSLLAMSSSSGYRSGLSLDNFQSQIDPFSNEALFKDMFRRFKLEVGRFFQLHATFQWLCISLVRLPNLSATLTRVRTVRLLPFIHITSKLMFLFLSFFQFIMLTFLQWK